MQNRSISKADRISFNTFQQSNKLTGRNNVMVSSIARVALIALAFKQDSDFFFLQPMLQCFTKVLSFLSLVLVFPSPFLFFALNPRSPAQLESRVTYIKSERKVKANKRSLYGMLCAHAFKHPS